MALAGAFLCLPFLHFFITCVNAEGKYREETRRIFAYVVCRPPIRRLVWRNTNRPLLRSETVNLLDSYNYNYYNNKMDLCMLDQSPQASHPKDWLSFIRQNTREFKERINLILIILFNFIIIV